MDRREALRQAALIMGGTIIGSSYFMLHGCGSDARGTASLFDPDMIGELDEIAETIIPASDTPGAKAAKVGEFMALMVKDCYEETEQKIFRNGIDKLNKLTKEKYGVVFTKCDAHQRKQILNELDAEQKDYTSKKSPDDPPHYFRMMKELTLLGFFTSETGATKTLRYVAVPGRYDGEFPYKKGDKAWAV